MLLTGCQLRERGSSAGPSWRKPGSKGCETPSAPAVPWYRGMQGGREAREDGGLGSCGCEANELEEREAAASALTREGAAPGRALGRPHARCQLHAGRCPDAFASPCSSPACLWVTARPRAAARKGKARLGHVAQDRRESTPPCPSPCPAQGPAAAGALAAATPASGDGFSASSRARPGSPTAALKYSGGKSPAAPCVAFYLNNILSWMTSLCNVV